MDEQIALEEFQKRQMDTTEHDLEMDKDEKKQIASSEKKLKGEQQPFHLAPMDVTDTIEVKDGSHSLRGPPNACIDEDEYETAAVKSKLRRGTEKARYKHGIKENELLPDIDNQRS